MAKTELVISTCTLDAKGVARVDRSGAEFRAQINPAGYNRDFSVKYTKDAALGQASSEAKFFAILPQTLNLKELVLDGSGVVAGTTVTVKQQIDLLTKVAVGYVGEDHQPSVVCVVWGSLIFYGRVESLKCDYTLFTPGGEPLRAKVTLNLTQYTGSVEIAREMAQSSPDLTHLVQVQAGDTLALLCNRIYGDSAYYPEVARSNGLSNFRQLQPGTTLRFPPLAQAGLDK